MRMISYQAAPIPVRPDYAAAYSRFWIRLAGPGSWFSGAEGIAIACEARQAWDCSLCRQRKQALSPLPTPAR